MNFRSLIAVGAFSTCALFATQAQDADRAKVEKYIIESEAQWAEADVKGDTAAVERIVADDFVGVAPDGSFYDKAAAIVETREAKGNTLSNHVNEVKVRFYGDTAVAQGSESWERRTGEPKRGRYVWTDTWVMRDNKWQVVAAEDLMAQEPQKK
jgi:ketosteroid isomerase-like protein